MYVFNDEGSNFVFVGKFDINDTVEESSSSKSEAEPYASPELTLIGFNYSHTYQLQSVYTYDSSSGMYRYVNIPVMGTDANVVFKRVDYSQNKIIDLTLRD